MNRCFAWKRLAGAVVLVLLAGCAATDPYDASDPASQPGLFYRCMVLLTLAMGLQAATLKNISVHSVHTTFVIGVVGDIADHAVTYIAWLHTQAGRTGARRAVRDPLQQASFRRLLALGGLWGIIRRGSDLRRRTPAAEVPGGAVGADDGAHGVDPGRSGSTVRPTDSSARPDELAGATPLAENRPARA